MRSPHPAQVVVELVVTLQVARAGLVEKPGEACDGNRRQAAERSHRRNQTRDQSAGIEREILGRAIVIDLQESETGLVDDARRNQAGIRRPGVVARGAEAAPVAVLVGGIAYARLIRSVARKVIAAHDPVLRSGW